MTSSWDTKRLDANDELNFARCHITYMSHIRGKNCQTWGYLHNLRKAIGEKDERSIRLTTRKEMLLARVTAVKVANWDDSVIDRIISCFAIGIMITAQTPLDDPVCEKISFSTKSTVFQSFREDNMVLQCVYVLRKHEIG